LLQYGKIKLQTRTLQIF